MGQRAALKPAGFFPVAFAWDSSSGFPKSLVMGDSRLSKSRQEFVNGSGSIVLLPADAANQNSSINISVFLGQEAFGVFFCEYHC